MKKLLKQIESGDIKNIKRFYLIFGEEDYLKDYFINKIKKKLVSQEFLDINFNIFDMFYNNLDIDLVINSASCLPFMSQFRLTVIKNSGLFYIGKKKETEKFLNSINNFPDSSIILFCETKIDKRNKLYKKISEYEGVCEIKKPSDKELVKWIIKICQANKKIISSQNAMLILKTTMGNMNLLKNELDKLIAYNFSISEDKQKDQEITEQQINLLCTKSFEAKIFDLVSAMGNKNLKLAIESYNNLLFLKEQPIMILAMISRQFVLFLQTKIFLKNNSDITAIAQKLNMRSFVIYDCAKQAKNFSESVLISAIKECTEIDFKIKTGKLADRLAVETLIIKYAS